jgi:phage recombination protein Bet
MSAVVTTMTADEAARHDQSLIDVLVHSLYPGASRDSASMVLAYCRAAGLDPMQKPVHIVPMNVKSGNKDSYGNDIYVKKDVVMPGIGLYRVQAARTGQYAGQDEPVWGPVKTITYSERKREWVEVPGRDRKQPRDTWVERTLEYPEWCAVSVYRLVGGFRSKFTAVEYWLENYATAGRDSDAPNEMWARRTRGQLAKCAEAQALRKGFPEVGAQPTAEEMEGRVFDDAAPEFTSQATTSGPQRMSERAALPDATAEQAAAQAVMNAATTAAADNVIAQPVGSPAPVPAQAPPPAPPAQAPAPAAGDPASEGERKNVVITAKAKRIDVVALLRELGYGLDPATLAGLTRPQFKALKARLA